MIGTRLIDHPLYGQGKFQWDDIAFSCPNLQEVKEVVAVAGGIGLVRKRDIPGGRWAMPT